jgi:hypothetical protein
VPGSSGFRKFFSAVEIERVVKADCTPAAQHDRGKAAAARRAPPRDPWGVTSVAPATSVARHDGIDSQDFSLLPSFPCRVVSQGCSRSALPPLLSNALRQEAFQEQWRPGTGHALCQRGGEVDVQCLQSVCNGEEERRTPPLVQRESIHSLRATTPATLRPRATVALPQPPASGSVWLCTILTGAEQAP